MPLFCTFFSVIIRISFARIKVYAAQVSVCVCVQVHIIFLFLLVFLFILDSTCSFSHCLTFSYSFPLTTLNLSLSSLSHFFFSSMKITLNSTMISTLNCEYIHTTANNVWYNSMSFSLGKTHIYMHARMCFSVMVCVCVCTMSIVPTMDKINCIRDSIQMVISNKEIV